VKRIRYDTAIWARNAVSVLDQVFAPQARVVPRSQSCSISGRQATTSSALSNEISCVGIKRSPVVKGFYGGINTGRTSLLTIAISSARARHLRPLNNAFS